MSTFEKTHADVVAALPDVKQYRSLGTTGTIYEAWEKDESGCWHDVTLREQEKQRIEREIIKIQREILMLTEVTHA